MKINIVDAIDTLKQIAVEDGNLEIMVITEIDGQIVAQRGFKFHVVEIESDKKRKRMICALMRDDMKDVAEVGLAAKSERRKKNEGMN